MAKIRKVNPEIFREVKWRLRLFQSPTWAARKSDLSVKTVIQIRGCKNFDEYEQNVRAQHPPVRYSLRDEIIDIHERIFNQPGSDYIRPEVAKVAIDQINEYFTECEKDLKNESTNN